MVKTTRRISSRLLWVVGIFLTWKVIRTDWVVDFPYKVQNPSDSGAYSIVLPVSPLWRPPQPKAVESWAENWRSLFPRDFGQDVIWVGEPKLHPYWTAIILKLLGVFAVGYLFVVWLSLKPSLEPDGY